MTNQYLKETKMLDYSHKSIQKLIRERKWSDFPEKERVKKIYNFVKDEILFGYNSDDKIKASKVLKDGYGQCNTKGTLLWLFFVRAAFRAGYTVFTIDKALQKGAMTGIVYKSAPKEIFHSYVEVCVCGVWYNLEGFILDNAYLTALQKTFLPEKDGSFTGYGVATKNFVNPPVEFDCCDTYIQKEGIVRDFGVFGDPDSLLKEHGQQMNFLKKCVYRLIGRRLMNNNVKKIRNRSV